MYVRLLSVIVVLCAGYVMFGGYVQANLLYSPEHMVVQFGHSIGQVIENIAAKFGLMIWS